jgi:DNA repair photolyase
LKSYRSSNTSPLGTVSNSISRAGPRKGRGATSNPANRYEAWHREAIDDGWGSLEQPPERLLTELGIDASRSVITYNNSPDVPFDRSINPYRGCEHGCVYCFARPSHAYLGYSPGLDFETRLLHKPDAPELLRDELARPGYRCETIALGVNTDAYQPVERRLGLTRRILQVLATCEHPVSVVTKAALIERDLDLLGPMAARGLASVAVSVTTLDHGLARRMEPRATAPRRRLQTIATLSEAGIPVTVLVAPVIPFINDAELETILEAAREAGAVAAAYIVLRLPHELKALFNDWLEAHYPERAERVRNRIRDLRGGKENDPRFGSRMTGTGTYATLIAKRFDLACRRLGLSHGRPGLDTTRFHPPRADQPQLDLFSGS